MPPIWHGHSADHYNHERWCGDNADQNDLAEIARELAEAQRRSAANVARMRAEIAAQYPVAPETKGESNEH